MNKAAIWIGASVGGFIGGWIPSLWGADFLSPMSVLLSTVGGLLGIFAVVKLYQSN